MAALLAAAALLLAAACGGEREPVTVPLSRLVAERESYEGRRVETRGTVEAFGEEGATRHYVVADARANRVQLLPEDAVAEHVGREVIVVGEFGFDEQSGRFIWVERIRTAG